MTKNALLPALCILSATALVPVFAQEAAPVLAVDTTAAEAAGDETALTPLARWQADATTIFEAAEVSLDAFKWVARPVVIFADAPQDPAFIEQVALLRDRIDELALRDVVVITDTDPEGRSAIRQRLRPRGFMLALLGKDGEVKLRKPFPWDVRELTRSIDKMPMRQREIRERR
ncbi:DUF4174 domain-containing protein [Palleronia sediminis]|uniref:DUF4174 domain-containing protein n=1 Tax=Palleronia sediminis TaxID=2547833 RepID=A0A4R6AE54_9RHOB|nr:DUF4174 domain-containing protein [Palleronia sediminis]TDL81312.1 DUF4174 domain-containing protein [Palleronia sediminis]